MPLDFTGHYAPARQRYPIRGFYRNLFQYFKRKRPSQGSSLALGLAYLFLPFFNTLADKSLNLAFVKSFWFALGLLTATILFGGLAGIYPAFYLSRFAPTSVLKGKQGKNTRSGKFRKGLIIFQFAISTALIVLTFGVKDQLNYIQIKKLGFHKNNVLVMPLRDTSIKKQYLYIYPRHFSYLLVRLRGEDVQAGLQSVRRTWKKIVPGRPFEYFFLDHDFGRFYRAEQRAGKIFGGFAFLAVVIALLGLYGLTAFTAEQKSKEVGIRKVLGASVPGVVRMLTSEFTKLVLMANVMAWPLAYYLIWKWLQNFAYRTDTSIWIFISAVGLTLGLTLVTVSVQAIRTARTDPVQVLRSE
ncbi:MAG: FtsX-like permease family protein [Candidatus Aminicenantes bacterium]|nr:FtsX-like permease family protein [Candidatus Aminicenantes bacterium]